MKKWSDRKQALAMAIAWTVSAAIWYAEVFFNIGIGRNLLSVIATVLFTIDAVLWWLRYAKMRKETASEEKETP